VPCSNFLLLTSRCILLKVVPESFGSSASIKQMALVVGQVDGEDELGPTEGKCTKGSSIVKSFGNDSNSTKPNVSSLVREDGIELDSLDGQSGCSGGYICSHVRSHWRLRIDTGAG
jgi:hypothetical protein